MLTHLEFPGCPIQSRSVSRLLENYLRTSVGKCCRREGGGSEATITVSSLREDDDHIYPIVDAVMAVETCNKQIYLIAKVVGAVQRSYADNITTIEDKSSIKPDTASKCDDESIMAVEEFTSLPIPVVCSISGIENGQSGVHPLPTPPASPSRSMYAPSGAGSAPAWEEAIRLGPTRTSRMNYGPQLRQPPAGTPPRTERRTVEKTLQGRSRWRAGGSG